MLNPVAASSSDTRQLPVIDQQTVKPLRQKRRGRGRPEEGVRALWQVTQTVPATRTDLRPTDRTAPAPGSAEEIELPATFTTSDEMGFEKS